MRKRSGMSCEGLAERRGWVHGNSSCDKIKGKVDKWAWAILCIVSVDLNKLMKIKGHLGHDQAV